MQEYDFIKYKLIKNIKKISNKLFQKFILFFCVYNLNFLQLQIFIWTRSSEATTWELIHSTVSQMNPNYIMTSALSSFSLCFFLSLWECLSNEAGIRALASRVA